jgi:hypothetical protein
LGLYRRQEGVGRVDFSSQSLTVEQNETAVARPLSKPIGVNEALKRGVFAGLGKNVREGGLVSNCRHGVGDEGAEVVEART